MLKNLINESKKKTSMQVEYLTNRKKRKNPNNILREKSE